MKPASSALIAYLNMVRAQRDKQLYMADCFTFTLLSGLILTYTNVDVPIALNGYTYAANAVLVDGLKYKCATGLDVDQQQIAISARPTDTINGAPFLVALRNGAFDGCEVQRDRAFLSSWSAAPIGSVLLFRGRVSTVDEVGRTTAKVTIASDLTLLDLDMPRNVYQPTCTHGVKRPQPGDVAVFRYGRCYSHGGIVTDTEPLTIVHTYHPAARVLEETIGQNVHLKDPARAARFFSYWTASA